MDINLLKAIFTTLLLFLVFSEGLITSAHTIETTRSNFSANNETWDKTNIQLIENLNVYHDRIVSFDVSDKGLVVLATKNRKILVLDDCGNLLKAFAFVSAGDYYVQWNNDNLVLYLIRGDKAIEFSMEAECISVSILDSNEAHEMWNNFDKLKKIVVNNNTYEVKREMGVLSNILFSGEYTKLLKTDSAGNTTILYEVDQRDIKNTKFIVLVVLVLIVVINITIIVAILISVKKIKDRTR